MKKNKKHKMKSIKIGVLASSTKKHFSREKKTKKLETIEKNQSKTL